MVYNIINIYSWPSDNIGVSGADTPPTQVKNLCNFTGSPPSYP